MSTFEDNKTIQVIELYMMDKRKYLPLALLSGVTVRGILYPVMLIKTRIQIQKQKSYYKGTFDAFRKISHTEGIRGLYKGFWVSNLLIVPQMAYITTYEHMREFLKDQTSLKSNKTRSFVSGGCASMVSQTFIVPIDIITQHLMLITKFKESETVNQKDKLSVHKTTKPPSYEPLNIPKEALDSNFGRTTAVVKAIYRQNGIRGFYKGYFTSLSVYAPSSAMWWFFYDIYSDALDRVVPDWLPRLAVQCLAAPMGGITTALITNPLDIVRARIQVENTKFAETAQSLWKEEKLGIFSKGLSARLVQSVMFSFFIILGYESIKRLSLRDEYKHSVSW